MVWKKVVAAVVMVVIIVISLYFTYFRHPPPEDILAANMAKRSHPKDLGCCCCGNRGGQADYDYESSQEADIDPEADVDKWWKQFIRKNNFVDVGTIYTKCEGDDKSIMGKVIMLPDKANGGVMTRTFVNVTIENEVTTGDVHVISMYNGKELYNSIWEVCTAEDNMPDHVIECPIEPGKKSYVKDLPIPSYLPKGTYASKAWVTDPDGKQLGCSLSEFTI